MGIYSQFKTSAKCEENGITVRFKPNDDGTIPSFQIARSGRNNINWVKTFEEETRPFKKEIEEKTITEDESKRINLIIFCKAIVKGWDNIQGPTGTVIDFTYDNAIMLFTNLPELYETLNAKSFERDNYLEANLKADEKN